MSESQCLTIRSNIRIDQVAAMLLPQVAWFIFERLFSPVGCCCCGATSATVTECTPVCPVLSRL
jgi:hypothetical protein